MKFKNFDIEDVFGPDDVEQAKGYVGMLGYFEDNLNDLDNAIAYFPEQRYKLVRIKQIRCDSKYVMGPCSFKYFLPLEKIKKRKYASDFKTESVKKDQQYRPLRNKRELIEFICKNTNSSQVIGTVICIKKKGESQVTVTTITAITDYFDPLSDKPIYEITLGTGKTYSFECLFGLFEIAFNYDQLWRPFGVLENE